MIRTTCFVIFNLELWHWRWTCSDGFGALLCALWQCTMHTKFHVISTYDDKVIFRTNPPNARQPPANRPPDICDHIICPVSIYDTRVLYRKIIPITSPQIKKYLMKFIISLPVAIWHTKSSKRVTVEIIAMIYLKIGISHFRQRYIIIKIIKMFKNSIWLKLSK